MNIPEGRLPDDTDEVTFTRFDFGMIPAKNGFSEDEGARVNEGNSYKEQVGIVWRVFNEVARWAREFGIDPKGNSVDEEVRQRILANPLAHQNLVFSGIELDVLDEYLKQAVLLSQKQDHWMTEDNLRVFLEGDESRKEPMNTALLDLVRVMMLRKEATLEPWIRLWLGCCRIQITWRRFGRWLVRKAWFWIWRLWKTDVL